MKGQKDAPLGHCGLQYLTPIQLSVSGNSDSILARLENLLEWQRTYDPQGSPATFEPDALCQKSSEGSSEPVTSSQM